MTPPARAILLLHLALATIAVLPLFLVESVPLDDYPNHLARMHILVEHARSPALQSVYDVRWAPFPNLGMELVVVPLAALVPVELAGRLFLALVLVLLVAGVAAVHRVLTGRWSAWPAAVFLLLYNDTFLFGFVNYLFALGLALLLFAAWVALAGARPWPRTAAGAAGALALFLAHLTGFGVYLVLVGGWTIERAIRAGGTRTLARETVLFAATLVPAAAVFVLLSPTSGAAGDASFGNFLDPWHYLAKPDLLLDVFRSYVHVLDQATATVFALVVVIGLATRRLRFAAGGLLPFLALAAAFALTPKLLFSSDFVDDRLAVAVLLVLVAVLDPGPMARPAAGALALLLALFLVRTAVVADTWMGYDRSFAAYRAAFRTLPEGSRLFAAIAVCCDRWARRRPPLHHFPNYVVLERNGFYPTIFAHPSRQPIALRAPFDAIAAATADDATIWTGGPRGASSLARDPFAPARLAGFDHAFVVGAGRFGTRPPPNFRAIATGADFALYRIEATP